MYTMAADNDCKQAQAQAQGSGRSYAPDLATYGRSGGGKASDLATGGARCSEPLQQEAHRFALYPLQHPDIFEMYKQQVASFWTVEEIDFSKDWNDWVQLTEGERTFIKHILAFFAGSDTVVSLNIMDNFCAEVKVLEAQYAYMFQAAIESIHSEAYSIMIETYIKDATEKADLLGNVSALPAVQQKMDWAKRWAATDRGLARRLLAFAVVEGVFFSSAFCAIYWLKQRNVLPGLTKSNEFIARDEGMHTDFACLLYSKISDRVPEAEVLALVRDAVDIERHFITDSIPCSLIGMNAGLMVQYIEYVADRLLRQLGYRAAFGSKNPFPFMEMLGLEGKSNFFEARSSLYQKATVFNEARGADLRVLDEF